MTTALTIAYLALFQLCAVPAVIRIWRRRSSADLSVWREILLLVGCGIQLYVLLSLGQKWNAWISPVMTITSVSVLLVTIKLNRVQ